MGGDIALPPSPLERIRHPAAAHLRLFCKRDDLYTPAPGTALQGNKVRKLAPVLRRALSANKPPLLVSFGGAYSNHLTALATAGRLFGLKAHLVVRGEEVDNAVLRRAEAEGATLQRVSRSSYRARNTPGYQRELLNRLAGQYDLPRESVWLVPEGGTTEEGVVSAGRAYAETSEQLGYAPDFFCLSAGTGGTAAGTIRAAEAATRVEVFSALKGSWMGQAIGEWLPAEVDCRWVVHANYHFGGYGKYPKAWSAHGDGLAGRADINEPGLPPLEPIYTGKLFSGVLDRMRSGYYPAGSTVVVLHTGGIY